MPMTWNEAVAALTGPGAPFEIVEADVLGQTTRVYKNTPRSLRALFDTARARGDATFLVYEDERWSFAETMARVDALGAALARARRAARRPRRDRDAQLPGVGGGLRGDHLDRRDLGLPQRLVDDGGARLRAARLGQPGRDRRPRARRCASRRCSAGSRCA